MATTDVLLTKTQAPNDSLDYEIDWSAWLGEDTIAVSTWSATEGVTVEEGSKPTDTTTKTRISGGTLHKAYIVTNHITTATTGEQKDKSFELRIEVE